MILITGATGRAGFVAARELAQRGLPVRALVRNPDKAAALVAAGVQLAIGDAADAVAVRAACAGVDRIAIILPNGESQLANEKHLADVAVASGVRHVLKVSSVESHEGAPNPVHRTHWESEQHVRRVAPAWTIVRPSFYLQNFLGNAATIKAEGKFYYPFGDQGAAVFMDARDVGQFIAHVFSTSGHENRSYDITSPDRMSFHDVAAIFTRVLGRPVQYVPQDPAAYRAFLGQFLKSQWHLDAVCDIFAEIAKGYVSVPTTTFRDVTGRDPVTVEGFIREHRAAFQPA
jgi:uncharacterized protein YbjT (DUF2867 family)